MWIKACAGEPFFPNSDDVAHTFVQDTTMENTLAGPLGLRSFSVISDGLTSCQWLIFVQMEDKRHLNRVISLMDLRINDKRLCELRDYFSSPTTWIRFTTGNDLCQLPTWRPLLPDTWVNTHKMAIFSTTSQWIISTGSGKVSVGRRYLVSIF